MESKTESSFRPDENYVAALAKRENLPLETALDVLKKHALAWTIEALACGERPFTMSLKMSLYTIIYHQCNKQANDSPEEKRIYALYSSALKNLCKTSLVERLQNKLKNASHEAFLRAFSEIWLHYCRIVRCSYIIFQYLDRFYTSRRGGDEREEPRTQVRPLREMAYTLFREYLFKRFRGPIQRAIIHFLNQERRGVGRVPQQVLADAVQPFRTIDDLCGEHDRSGHAFTHDLARPLQEQLREFCSEQADQLLKRCTMYEYLVEVQKLIADEESRVEMVMGKEQWPESREIMYEALLHDKVDEVCACAQGLDYCFSNNKISMLLKLHKSYAASRGGIKIMADGFASYVKQCGARFFQEFKSGGKSKQALVEQLVDMHERLRNICDLAFQRDLMFNKALQLGFGKFINNADGLPRMLAHFVSDVMERGGSKQMSDKEFSTFADNIVLLYSYLECKDLFEHFYKALFGQRLLHNRSRQIRWETQFISKLKNHAGQLWPAKLEAMLADLRDSTNVNNRFRSEVTPSRILGFNYSVTVVKTGFIPARDLRVNMPPELTQATDLFAAFYTRAIGHMSHELQWRMDLGEATVSLQFSPKSKTRYQFTVTTPAMMVLLLFNEVKPMGALSAERICLATGLDLDTLRPHLLNLAHPQNGCILQKRPNNPSLDANHQFRINPEYKSKLRRYRVKEVFFSNVHLSSAKAVPESVRTMRKQMIQAAITRVMKTAKTMGHAQLSTEVMELLSSRFKVAGRDVQRGISQCISDRTLKRDENERSVYHYLS